MTTTTKTALLASIGACVALASNLAAANDKPHCRQIRGTGEQPVFQLPCERDPSYNNCLLGSTQGDLKATWESFFHQVPTDIGGFGLPVPPEAISTLYQSEVDVFTTRHGTLTGYAHYIVDERTFDSGGLSSTIYITGGTGRYRGATGWIAVIAKDPQLVTFEIFGHLCGPALPGAKDERDDAGIEELGLSDAAGN
ncbi:MAG TPA: hypothetical protein VH814_25950 [Steroidobacteraceae bacterium]|jgi:hypothetical protein